MNSIFLKSLPYIAALIFGAICAWVWQDNSYGKIIADNKATYQTDLTLIANAGAAQARQAVEKQQLAEQENADLDARLTKEKADGLAENDALRKLYGGMQADNDRLRTAVDDGKRRLRIAGACTSGSGSSQLSEASSTAGLGDAGAIELAPSAGRTVFDIRAGIISDQTALKALQEYVVRVCNH